MKIYLDLEANCTTNEAISIGMVTENGDTFYSLIRPHTKLDHNIKVLTGVSQEDADQAPSLEEAMLGVREFLSFLDEENTFYHYGKSDRGFLRASMGFTTDMKALTTLQYIHNRCENVDKRVASHFRRDAIGLRSAYLTMKLSSEDPIQNHNALEDAWMLKYVWENINGYTLPDGIEPVKVPKVKMSYGKSKANPASPEELMNRRLTAKQPRSRRNEAIRNCPAIDDDKYKIAGVAIKGEREIPFKEIYEVKGFVHVGRFKTAAQVLHALDVIYAAMETGKGNPDTKGWIFKKVEKQ